MFIVLENCILIRNTPNASPCYVEYIDIRKAIMNRLKQRDNVRK